MLFIIIINNFYCQNGFQTLFSCGTSLHFQCNEVLWDMGLRNDLVVSTFLNSWKLTSAMKLTYQPCTVRLVRLLRLLNRKLKRKYILFKLTNNTVQSQTLLKCLVS